MSCAPTACLHVSARLALDEYPLLLVPEIYAEKIKIWLKQGKGIGHFKWKNNFCCCRRHKNAIKALASNEVI
jgi:hypothetical protein